MSVIFALFYLLYAYARALDANHGAELMRSRARELLEHTVEIRRVFKSDHFRDFADFQVRLKKILLCFFYAVIRNIVRHVLFHHAHEEF